MKFRTSLASQNAKYASYTVWLNKIFNIRFSGWRERALAPLSNPEQCARAMDGVYLVNGSLRQYQLDEQPICYICGQNTNGDPHTIECEHILPIATALSHWWLVKNDNNSELNDLLTHEYNIAHKCCNQIKSNVDLISIVGGHYVPNVVAIRTLLNKISKEQRIPEQGLGCNNLLPLSKNNQKDCEKNIIAVLGPLILGINKNVQKFKEGDDQFVNHGLYDLFTKLKLLSAISNDLFIEAISGNAVAIEKTAGKRYADSSPESSDPYRRKRIKSYRGNGPRRGAEGPPAPVDAQGGGMYETVDFPINLLNIATQFVTNGKHKEYSELDLEGDEYYALIAKYIQTNPLFTDYNEIAQYFVTLFIEHNLIDGYNEVHRYLLKKEHSESIDQFSNRPARLIEPVYGGSHTRKSTSKQRKYRNRKTRRSKL